MTPPPTITRTPEHPCRQRRLSRGWQPVQLIGRMKIEAAKDGFGLPKTYLMLRWLFLWENQRTPMPGYYAGLLERILDAGGHPRG
jgi:hypothetical protein